MRGGDDLVLAAVEQLLPHVTDVGDVLDVLDLEAARCEVAAQPVGHEVRAQVADVDVAVDGRAAGVDRGPPGFQRLEGLFAAGKRVVELEQCTLA